MKVLLINPPRINEIMGNNPSIIEEERGFNPPLGLLYIAGFVEKNSDHEISIIDAQVERLSYSKLEDRINESGAQVIGISAMTFTLRDVIKTIDTIKKSKVKDATIVLGGPHVHLYPEETINLPNVDYLLCGEGEHSFCQFLNALEQNEDPATIPGIVFKKDGAIVKSPVSPLVTDLDDLPFPARHIVPHLKYSSLLSKGGVVTTIFTSRGCPFKCSFCDRPHLGKKFRARSAENVVAELKECVSMGINEFLIYDDTFTIDKKRVIDICELIDKEKLSITFDIRARIDTVNEEVLKRLKKAGCCGIHYGIEAGTQKILDVLNKQISIEKSKEVFELTKKVGIPVLAYFMIGSPTETVEDIEETFRVTRWLDPDFVHMTILTPFPGTKIYDDGVKSGRYAADPWRLFAANPLADFTPPHWDEILTRDELQVLLTKGYRSFYLRPGYIIRRLRALSSWAEFVKKAKAGIKVFLMKPPKE